jgi:hypothetical protein
MVVLGKAILLVIGKLKINKTVQLNNKPAHHAGWRMMSGQETYFFSILVPYLNHGG